MKSLPWITMPRTPADLNSAADRIRSLVDDAREEKESGTGTGIFSDGEHGFFDSLILHLEALAEQAEFPAPVKGAKKVKT